MSSYFFISIIFIVLLQHYNVICASIFEEIIIIKTDRSIKVRYMNQNIGSYSSCKFHHMKNNTEIMVERVPGIIDDDFVITSTIDSDIMKRYSLKLPIVKPLWLHLSRMACDLIIDSPLPSDNGDWVCSQKEFYGNVIVETNITINIQESVIGLNDDEYRIEKQTIIIKPGVNFTVRSIPIDKKYGYELCWLVGPGETIYKASDEDMKNGNCTVRIVNATKQHTGTWKWRLYSSQMSDSTPVFKRYIEEYFSIAVDDFKEIATESSVPAQTEDKKIASLGKDEEIITKISEEKTTVAPNLKEKIISNVTEKTIPASEEITKDSIFEIFYVKIIVVSAITVLVISFGMYFKIWANIKLKLFGNNSYNGYV